MRGPAWRSFRFVSGSNPAENYLRREFGLRQERNTLTTSLNILMTMALYVPVVSLLTGIQDIPIDRWQLAISAAVFIGIPLVLGIISKRISTLVYKE